VLKHFFYPTKKLDQKIGNRAMEESNKQLQEIIGVLKRIDQKLEYWAMLSGNPDPLYFLQKLPTDLETSAKWEDSIFSFLEAHQIKVINHDEIGAEDLVINRIADYMALHWDQIKKAYRKIKANLNATQNTIISIKDLGSKQELVLRTWFESLYKIAFFENYNHVPQNHFALKISSNPAAIAFMTGYWLEFHLESKLIELLSKRLITGSGNELVRNVKIELPNGDPGELDAIVKLNNQIYWFEVKTGPYQRHLPKYKRFAAMMGLGANHAILLLPEIDSSTQHDITQLYQIRPLGIRHLTVFLDGLL